MLAKFISFSLRYFHSICVVLCIGLTVPQYALAEQETAGCSQVAPHDGLLLEEITCMTDEELQTFRGGFIQNNQIVIGFGFERIVRVDGEIQEHILAGLPSLNLTNNIQLVPINRSLDSGGNRFLLDAGTGSAAYEGRLATDASISGSSPQLQLIPSTSALQDVMNNVIQNSLDDKVFDQIRVVNIDLIGLGSTPRFDPHTDLNPALFESLGL